MRRIILSIVIIAFFALAPFAVVLSGAMSASQSRLDFVAPTAMELGDASLALCHRVESYSLLGLGIGHWNVSRGYVLSDTGCVGEEFLLDPRLIEQGFAAGLIPADVPREPGIAPSERLTGILGGLLIAALLGMGVLFSLTGRTRRVERMEVLDLEDGPVFRFLDAMLHAARVDGRPTDDQVDFIVQTSRDVAGKDYSNEHVRYAISRCDRLFRASDFDQFGAELSYDQARMVLQGALAVLSTGPELSRKQRRFVARLADGLKLRYADVEDILETRQERAGSSRASFA